MALKTKLSTPLARRRSSAPVCASQIRTVLSLEPVIISLPSGEKPTLLTCLACPVNLRTTSPVSTSHSLTSLSPSPCGLVIAPPPESTYFPSGENATPWIWSACPLTTRMCFWVWASPSRAVPSQLPVSTYFPSGEKATLFTNPWCPSNRPASWPDCVSHRCASLSPDPVTTYLPSGEKA